MPCNPWRHPTLHGRRAFRSLPRSPGANEFEGSLSHCDDGTAPHEARAHALLWMATGTLGNAFRLHTVTDSVMIGEGNQRGTFQLGSRVSVWSTMPATRVPAVIEGLVHRYCS